MTIAEPQAPDKGSGRSLASRVGELAMRIPKDAFWAGALILAILSGIGLGILIERENGAQQDQLWIENLTPEQRGIGPATTTSSVPGIPTQAAAAAAAIAPKPAAPVDGIVVASKTGEVYYLPTCSAAKRITPEKLVTFASRAEAEAAGYRAAKNCKGL